VETKSGSISLVCGGGISPDFKVISRYTELGLLLHWDGNNGVAALLQVLQSGQGVRKAPIMTTMAMAMATGMVGQRRQVRQGQHVDKVDASTM
jgi:hypothetical protein